MIRTVNNDFNTIEISDLNAGFYFLNILTEDNKFAIKKFNKVN